MSPIDKSLTHGSQVVMRCSLQMVYQWTEELSIRTNGANRKASLTNGDFLPMLPLVTVFLTIGICLCILDMCETTVVPGRRLIAGLYFINYQNSFRFILFKF